MKTTCWKGCATALGFAVMVVAVQPASADVQNHTITRGELSCPDSVRAKNFLGEFDDSGVFELGVRGPGPGGTVTCGCQVSDGGTPRKGVLVDFGFELVDQDGHSTPLGSSRGRTRRNGWASAQFNPPPVAGVEALARMTFGTRKNMDSADCYCAQGTPAPCIPSDTLACIDGSRFKVEGEFRDPFDGRERPLIVDYSRGNEALFFFSPANWELLVKVIDACSDPNFNSFWVFYAATTNVEFELTVTDTRTGVAKEYSNPANVPFQPIQDTQAFATCP